MNQGYNKLHLEATLFCTAVTEIEGKFGVYRLALVSQSESEQ